MRHSTRILSAALLSFGLLSSGAMAKEGPLLDCPLRDAAFSVDTPLIDILLSPKARTLVESKAPKLLQSLPPLFKSTKAPAFGSIITLRSTAGMAEPGAIDIPALDATLRKLPVTRADRIARCARYDDDPVPVSVEQRPVRILLFEKMTGFRDGPSVDAASALFRDMAKRNGWALVQTDKAGVMLPEVLKQFNIVIWNNISGDVLTLKQRAAFRDYMEKGGGYLGIHGSNGDPVTFWPWYSDTLLGTRFIGHPSDPQFQTAQIRLEGNAPALTQGLPSSWPMKDEWYSFSQSPRLNGARIIATLDEASYSPGYNPFAKANLAMGADHPIAWTRCIGKGRMFYSAIGHMPETYADANHQKLLENAINWSANGPC